MIAQSAKIKKGWGKEIRTYTPTLLCVLGTQHSRRTTVSCEKKCGAKNGKSFPRPRSLPPRKTLNKSWNEQQPQHRGTTLIYVLKAALKTCRRHRAVIVHENEDRWEGGQVVAVGGNSSPGLATAFQH